MNNEDITTLDKLEDETKRAIAGLREEIVRAASKSENPPLVRLCAKLETYDNVLYVLKGKK